MKTNVNNNSEQKKKILIIRNLPPLIGGMERLNWQFYIL